MKYYEGWEVIPDGAPRHKWKKCIVCGKLARHFKLREDDKLVCLSCHDKDEDKDNIQLTKMP